MSTSPVIEKPQPAAQAPAARTDKKQSERVEGNAREAASRGKNEARRLRKQGRIPGVVYGANQDSIAVDIDPRHIMKILHSESGHNTIFDLDLGTESSKVMVVASQYEPIKGNLIHIDLKRIAMDKAMRVSVPVELQGVPEGVSQQGGILEHILREVEIECLPGDIPNQIDMDVSHLVFGQVIRVADLPPQEKIKILSSETLVVAHITAVKEEVVVTPEVAADAAVVAGAAAEPEVIKKGKQETEEPAAEAAGEKKKK